MIARKASDETRAHLWPDNVDGARQNRRGPDSVLLSARGVERDRRRNPCNKQQRMTYGFRMCRTFWPMTHLMSMVDHDCGLRQQESRHLVRCQSMMGLMELIFTESLSRLEKILKAAERPRSFKDEKTAFAARTELFKLEGWAKIHRHWPDSKERKIFEQIREQAKTLEDALGKVDVAKAFAKDLRAKDRSDLAENFDEQAKHAHKELKHILKSKEWFSKRDDETRVQKMQKMISSVDWPSVDRQFDYLEKAVIKDLEEVNGLFRSEWKPKLVDASYDRETVEFTLHKFRRQLRWFAIYFQTGHGLFALAPLPNTLTSEKRKLIADYKNSAFTKLPKTRHTRREIDRIAYYELTRLIDRLGEVKDQAEGYFYLRDILIKHGESEAKAEERAEMLYGDAPIETPVATQSILAEYERFKPLSYLVQSLR